MRALSNQEPVAMLTPRASSAYQVVFMTFVFATAIAIVGCGSAEPTDIGAVTTLPASTVVPDATPSSTTLALQSERKVAVLLEVTFDGEACTTEGPTVVPTDTHSFVLKDLTGEGLADVRTMAIAEGHTYEDLLDLQSEPGEYVPLPEWAEWPLTTFEPGDRELGDNDLGKRLILEPGVHGIVVGTGKGIWFCGRLTVTDS